MICWIDTDFTVEKDVWEVLLDDEWVQTRMKQSAEWYL